MSRFDGRLISGVGVFATAVETGSFVRTSELVGLTTSGVSRAIGRLEGRLGVRLFHRTPKGIQVTDDGRRFYEQTSPLLEGLAESANQIRACRGEAVGIVRVHADAASASHFLVPALREFMDANPQIEVRLEVRDRPSDCNADPCDLAVHLGGAQWGGMNGEPLFASEMLVCASPSYLEAKGVPEDPRALLKPPHACLPHGGAGGRTPTPWVLTRERETLAVEGDRRLAFTTSMTMVSATLNGLGIGCAPRFLVQQDLSAGRLLRLFEDWRAGVAVTYVFMPSNGSLSSKGRRLLDFLRERAATHERHLVKALPEQPRLQPA